MFGIRQSQMEYSSFKEITTVSREILKSRKYLERIYNVRVSSDDLSREKSIRDTDQNVSYRLKSHMFTETHRDF